MGDSALWYVQLLNITCLVLFIIAPWQLSLRLSDGTIFGAMHFLEK